MVAAITAATWCGRTALDPKPPPTCSDRTRTDPASREKRLASSIATSMLPWLESTTSSRPPSQRAVAACGSMGLWCSSGVVYRSSTTAAHAASRSSRSPFAVSVSCPMMLPGLYRPGCSAEKPTSCDSSSYCTVSASAASRACSDVSATTSATGQPKCGTRSCWKTWRIGSGGPMGLMYSDSTRGALPWCSTARTPGIARTGSASTARTRPRATVDSTSQPWASSAKGISPA